MRDGLAGAGHEVIGATLVSDDAGKIANAILDGVRAGANVVLTSGGTGLSPNDVTPEATRRVIEREVPGIAEALRARSLAKTPHGMLSRGVAGAVGGGPLGDIPGAPPAGGGGPAGLPPPPPPPRRRPRRARGRSGAARARRGR